MNKILIPVCVLAAVGAGGFAVVQIIGADDAKKQADALAADAAAENQALIDAAAALKKANAELEEVRANNARLIRERDEAKARAKEGIATNKTAEGEGVAETDAGKRQEGVQNLIQGFAKQMDNPDVRKAMRSGGERMVERAYEKLFAKLNLSEGDRKLVGELLADRNLAALDKARKLAGGKLDDAKAKEVRAEIAATKAEYDAKLKGVLGGQNFNELSGYEKTVGDQRALDFFARNFERKDMALQPEQKDGLLTIMREERLKIPGDEIPDLGGGPGMAVLYSDEETKVRREQEDRYEQAVVGRAGQAGLSPDQVNVLQDSFKQRREWQTMGRAMGRAFLGGGAQ